jgi:hypothetical protein
VIELGVTVCAQYVAEHDALLERVESYVPIVAAPPPDAPALATPVVMCVRAGRGALPGLTGLSGCRRSWR